MTKILDNYTQIPSLGPLKAPSLMGKETICHFLLFNLTVQSGLNKHAYSCIHQLYTNFRPKYLREKNVYPSVHRSLPGYILYSVPPDYVLGHSEYKIIFPFSIKINPIKLFLFLLSFLLCFTNGFYVISITLLPYFS